MPLEGITGAAALTLTLALVETPDGELAEDGRGFLLVGAVTDRWGVTVLAERAGKNTWCECGDGEAGEGTAWRDPL
ncbi:hypothetical protein GCM10010349_48220 [Streptomyces flavofungini]|nr:hypothetical protein GCM10010349_48220 [Streptomyces flavofungini]